MINNTAIFLILLVSVATQVGSAQSQNLKGKRIGTNSENNPRKIQQAKKKKDDKKGKQQLNLSVEDAEDLCTLLEVFDNMGRYENNDKSIPGFEWRDLCDDFHPLNHWLCPSESIVQTGICNHPRPWLNPAIRLHYCAPLLESLPVGPRRDACETWCTNYVSQDRGDCCEIKCESGSS